MYDAAAAATAISQTRPYSATDDAGAPSLQWVAHSRDGRARGTRTHRVDTATDGPDRRAPISDDTPGSDGRDGTEPTRRRAVRHAVGRGRRRSTAADQRRVVRRRRVGGPDVGRRVASHQPPGPVEQSVANDPPGRRVSITRIRINRGGLARRGPTYYYYYEDKGPKTATGR